MRTACTLLASAMLCCAPKVTAIPDPNVPHQFASETEGDIWVRLPDGRMAKQRVRVLEGWWLASPPLVEGE